jgi:hypothetical protein
VMYYVYVKGYDDCFVEASTMLKGAMER